MQLTAPATPLPVHNRCPGLLVSLLIKTTKRTQVPNGNSTLPFVPSIGMAYTDINFKSKAALRRAVKAGETVTIFQPGGIFPCVTDGAVTLEGPHYPAPHSWYANCVVKDRIVLSVK